MRKITRDENILSILTPYVNLQKAISATTQKFPALASDLSKGFASLLTQNWWLFDPISILF